MQKPAQIPIESLYGEKEDVGRTLRLQIAGVLPADRLGEFALQPQQAEVRAIFAPLARFQRDLGLPRQVNAMLLAGVTNADGTLDDALRLEDLGVRITDVGSGGAPLLALDTRTGIVNPELERAARDVAAKLGLRPVPVFTYLANAIRKGDRSVPYSLVTATDLDRVVTGTAAAPAADAIVLNDWTARELGAAVGDRVAMDYYLWDAVGRAAIEVRRVHRQRGRADDRHGRRSPTGAGLSGHHAGREPRRLGPAVPDRSLQGSSGRRSLLARIPDHAEGVRGLSARPELWHSRYGDLTSLRFGAGDTSRPDAAAFSTALRQALSPAAMSVSILRVSEQALAASAGATDFGEYFTVFQLLHRGLGAAARRALLQARCRAAAAGDWDPPCLRLHDARRSAA